MSESEKRESEEEREREVKRGVRQRREGRRGIITALSRLTWAEETDIPSSIDDLREEISDWVNEMHSLRYWIQFRDQCKKWKEEKGKEKKGQED